MESGSNQNQPGWVFTPNGDSVPPTAATDAPAPQAAPAEPAALPQESPATEPVTTSAPESGSAAEPTPAPEAPKPPSGPAPQPSQPFADSFPIQGDGVQWVASEFEAGQKNVGWFTLLALGTFVVAGLLYFITKDISSVVAVVLLAMAIAFVAGRKPESRHYAVSSRGIQIGSRLYPFDYFKSFSVMHEESAGSISLMPTKRFMPMLAMYFEPKDEDTIVDAISNFLPFEHRDHDFVDRFSRKIRF